ncbi:hypothetical protein AB0I28_37870 [Phytomonospora sp. NPDC050363]|uniref:hypothetical protein n=1 Tax=Phytomonospora sp. NPDC050363 TaxID=3155642 RepID=UPI0033F63E51
MRALALVIVVMATGVLTACSGAAPGIGPPGATETEPIGQQTEPSASTAAEQPFNDAITSHDWNNTVFNKGKDSEIAFEDGRANEFNSYIYTELWDPVYADLDGDNDVDALTIVQQLTGGTSNPTSFYVWLWQDGAPMQLSQQIMVRAGCDVGGGPPRAVGGTIEIPIWTAKEISLCVDGRVFESVITIAVRDGFPVATAPAFGAAEACELGPGNTPVAMPETGVPLVARDLAAPPVGIWTDFSEAVGIDHDTDGWTLVRLTRHDDTVSCGWIPPPATS